MMVTSFISVIRSGDARAFPIDMEEKDPLAALAEASKEDSDRGEP